jgi:ferric-dicitrate binding protein FerR (iron transport regulator)
MMEAVKDGDVEKAKKINEEAKEWIDSLNEEDAEEAEKAVFKWLEENPEAAVALMCL